MKIGSAQVTCESLTRDTKSVYILSLLTGVHNKRVSFSKKNISFPSGQTNCPLYIGVRVKRGSIEWDSNVCYIYIILL